MDILTPEILIAISKGHPRRAELDNAEQMALASYYGGESLQPYIKPYSIQEEPEKLAERRQQAMYHHRNFVKEISRKLTETVYTKAITRRVEHDDSLTEYLQQDFHAWYTQNVVNPALYLPEMYVLVELPDPTKINTRADVIKEKAYPNCRAFYPSSVHAVRLDRDGKVQWIAFKRSAPDGKIERWVYDDTHLHIINDKGAYIEEPTPHGFSRCPVVRMAWEENRAIPGIGVAYLVDVTRKSIALLQQIATFIEMISYHLFYELVVDEKTSRRIMKDGRGNATPLVAEAGESTGQSRSTSSTGITAGGFGQSFAPYYLTLPPTPIDEMKDIIYNLIPGDIYAEARLRTSDGKSASGTAKMIDLLPERNAVAAIASYLGTADYEICELILEGTGLDATDPKVFVHQYPLTFDIKGSQEYIADAAAIGDIIAKGNLPQSARGQRELMKSLYHNLSPDAPAATQAEIENEIDAWTPPTPAPTMPARPTTNGHPPNSSLATGLGKGGGMTARDATKAGA